MVSIKRKAGTMLVVFKRSLIGLEITRKDKTICRSKSLNGILQWIQLGKLETKKSIKNQMPTILTMFMAFFTY